MSPVSPLPAQLADGLGDGLDREPESGEDLPVRGRGSEAVEPHDDPVEPDVALPALRGPGLHRHAGTDAGRKDALPILRRSSLGSPSGRLRLRFPAQRDRNPFTVEGFDLEHELER